MIVEGWAATAAHPFAPLDLRLGAIAVCVTQVFGMNRDPYIRNGSHENRALDTIRRVTFGFGVTDS